MTNSTEVIGAPRFRESDLWALIEEFHANQSRNPKRDSLVEIIRGYHTDDVHSLLRLVCDEPLSDLDDATGVGGGHVRDALAGVTDRDPDVLTERKEEYGDWSFVVEEAFAPVDGENDLPLRESLNRLEDLADMSGDNPMSRVIGRWMLAADAPAAVSWICLNDVTLNMGASVARQAVQMHFNVDDDTWSRATGIQPITAKLYSRLQRNQDLQTELQPGMRYDKMKASNAAVPDDWEGEWITQTKYDGARVLIHKTGEGEPVQILSGGNNDRTHTLPEVRDLPWPDVPFIVEGEAMPYDPDTGEPLAFQQLMKRFNRTNAIIQSQGDTEVRLHLFELINWDGVDMTRDPFEVRWETLQTYFEECGLAATSRGDPDEMMVESLEAGHEGAVSKRLEAGYSFGRNMDWRKLKPDPDSVDLRICDATPGGGDMAGSLGAIEVETADGESLGSVGSGYSHVERADLWAEHQAGELVGRIVEVEFEELQTNSDGYALRFPVFQHFRPEGDVDSLERVREMDAA